MNPQLLIQLALFTFILLGCKKDTTIPPSPPTINFTDALLGKYIGLRHIKSFGAPPNFDTTYVDSVIVTALGNDSVNYDNWPMNLNPSTLSYVYNPSNQFSFSARFAHDSTFSYKMSSGMMHGTDNNFAGKKAL